MHQAFILGAGLGTRLQPLTHHLPKPLVPLFHRPLAAWALDSCIRAGAHRIAINTHHLPNAWEGFRHETAVHSCDVTYFHESVLLETGGGLKNIEPWIESGPLLVHNGDIFSTMPLERLIEAHRNLGTSVTLALRSFENPRHIALDAAGTHVRDIRGLLGQAQGTHLFTGIYCIGKHFLERIPAGQKVSVIPAFLELAKQQALGAVVIDDGVWLDLGDRNAYLNAHQTLDLAPAIHPLAHVDASATVEHSVVGPGAIIGAGAVVKNSVVWPGRIIAPQATLKRCIVCSPNAVSGTWSEKDL